MLVGLDFEKSFGQSKDYLASRKKTLPFSMVIRNEERILECFPKHSRMRTAIIKEDKEPDEEGNKRGVSIERSKAGKKNEVPTAYHYLIKMQ